ncbi:MAG: hypothetical protein AAFX76_08045 [Planctomycetota bacterium]
MSKPQSEGVRAFRQRLVLVDQVVGDLNQGFERQRSAALMDLLDDTLAPGSNRGNPGTSPGTSGVDLGVLAGPPALDGGPQPVPAAGTAHDSGSGLDTTLTADQLLVRYQPAFAQPLSTGGLTTEELDMMRRLYDHRLRRAGDRIAERGRAAAAAHPEDAAKAIAFSLVVPLLHVPDADWNAGQVSQLPAWLRQPELLTQLEETALRLHRPLTAWSFARAVAEDTPAGSESGRGEANAADYLRETSARLLRSDRYDDAVACLRGLLGQLSDRDAVEAVETRFKLAEVLADIGEPAEAAETLRPLIGGLTSDGSATSQRAATTSGVSGTSGVSWGGGGGKAVMMSLKYLYEAEDFEGLFALSDRYRDDEAVGGFRPQVLYITWVAARRTDRPHLAKTVRQSFLGGYAAHPLAADIYFAEAMEALARSDYDEAQRLLEYVVYRYPESRLIPRVEEIRKRLTGQTSAAP